MINLAKVGDTWFRIESRTVNNRMELTVVLHKVIKVSPQSVRVYDFSDKGKIVYLFSNKKFAHPTIQLAIESFIARRKRQIMLVSSQLSDAEKSKHIAETQAAQIMEEAHKSFIDKGVGRMFAGPIHMPGDIRTWSQSYYYEMGY